MFASTTQLFALTNLLHAGLLSRYHVDLLALKCQKSTVVGQSVLFGVIAGPFQQNILDLDTRLNETVQQSLKIQEISK